jgi:hypothetical protein
MTHHLESGVEWAELARLEKDLRDLWEGCVPWREAIEMIGAPEESRRELRRSWNGWNRKYAA